MAEHKINLDVDALLDLIANLSRRVASLESQLKDTQGNQERQAEELAEQRYISLALDDDIANMDERVIEIERRLDNGKSPKEVDAPLIALISKEVTDRLLGGNRQ